MALLLTRCTTSVSSKIATYDIGARPVRRPGASEVPRLVYLDPDFMASLTLLERSLWAIGWKRFTWQSVYLRLTS